MNLYPESEGFRNETLGNILLTFFPFAGGDDLFDVRMHKENNGIQYGQNGDPNRPEFNAPFSQSSKFAVCAIGDRSNGN